MIVFLDHQFVKESDAKIPVFDRGFLMGDGVYATLQVRDGTPLFLQTHLQRLENQCRSFGIDPPKIPPQLIYDLIEKNSATSGIYKLKIVITGGESHEMSLPKRKFGHLLIFVMPFTPAPYAPLKMGLFPHPIVSAHASFKSLAHLNRYFVMEYAKANGFDDAISTTESGVILEAAFANLFWIVEEKFFTPDKNLPLHFGVTIGEIASLYQAQGVRRRLAEIPDEALLFRCNTMSGIRPIASIGERKFARDEELERRLMSSLQVHNERSGSLGGGL